MLIVLPSAFAQNSEYYTKVEVTQILNGVSVIVASQEQAPVHCSVAEESTVLSPFEKFKAMVVEGKFAERAGVREVYSYASCTEDQFQVLGGVPYTSTSCSTKFERSAIGDNLIHAFGATDAEVKTKLKEIIEANSGAARSFMQLSSTSFRFLSGQHAYTFNTSYPASANPIARTDLQTGETYSLVDIKSYSL